MQLKRSFLLLFSLLLAPLAFPQEDFNPREQGEMDLEVEFYSDIKVFNGSLKTLDQFIYALPPGYSSLSVNSDSHEVVLDEYGNSQLVLKWGEFEGGDYSIKLRVKNSAVIETVPVTPFPLNPSRDALSFLESGEFISITDEIRGKAQEVVAGSRTGFEAVSRLSTWVYKNVKYDLSFGGDLKGSEFVFENRIGTCDEFSNLFIAMARSVGIPARYVAGVVYSPGGWGYHAWAEVFLGGKWVPVDPTWDEVGWLDATHIRLGHFKESGEVITKGKWTYVSSSRCVQGSTCPTATVESPQVKVRLLRSERLSPVFNVSVSVFPQVLGLGDSAVAEVTVENNAPGCLGTSTKIVSRVDDRKRDVLRVGEEKSLQLCENETRKAHFVLTARDDLSEFFVYRNLADIFTFLGGKSVVDLNINPRRKASSELDVSLEESVLREGETTTFSVKTTAPEFKVYSDLPVTNGNTLTASTQGEHYLIVAASTGEVVERKISVPAEVKFRLRGVQKTQDADCNAPVELSFELENVSAGESFQVDAGVTSELSPIPSIKVEVPKGSTQRVFLRSRLSGECTGSNQFIEVSVGGQRLYEKMTVKKPFKEQASEKLGELTAGAQEALEVLAAALAQLLAALGALVKQFFTEILGFKPAG